MPNVSVPDIAPGDTTSASGTNTFFTDLQTASATIDGTNTRSEWCSRYHIDQTAATPTFNTNFAQVVSSAQQVINSAVFTQVNMGTAFRITPAQPIVLAPGQVLRAHFDTLVTAMVTPAPPANNVTLNNDCYQFQFWYNDGITTTNFPCISTYSYSIIPRLSPGAQGPAVTASALTKKRTVQRVNHTMCYVNDTAGNITFNWIEVRARVVNVAWITSFTINQGDFNIMVGRF
jgi:hypothetical protein